LPGDKLPALSLPTATQGLSRTAYPDPSVTNSTNSSARTSLSSASVPVNEPRSPPSSADLSGTQGRLSLDSSAPTEYSLPPSVNEGYYPSPTSLGSMNQTQPYMDVHSHMSSAQSYAPQGATAGAMSQYQYHGQPPVMQPASSYAPAAYPQYGYPTGVTSPPTGHPPSSMGGQMPAQLLPLPGKLQSQNVIEDYSDRYQVSNHAVAPPSGYGNSTGAPLQGFVFDGTGQVAPPGAKPRVTATLWEDEGSLCYQVEAKGVCVARREGKLILWKKVNLRTVH
jgi:protein SOK2